MSYHPYSYQPLDSMQGGPRGFERAPVTKSLCAIYAVLSLVNQFYKRLPALTVFSLDAIKRGEVWRVFTYSLGLSNMGELILAMLLIYAWRLFERQFGSRKFSGALLFILTTNTLLLLLLTALLPSSSTLSIVPGPYFHAFGFLPMFVLDIPRTFVVRFCGLPVSDKTLLYILSLQLACVNWPHSAATAAVAMLSGLLYHILPSGCTGAIRIPAPIANVCYFIFKPIFGLGSSAAATSSSGRSGVAGGGMGGAGHRAQDGAGSYQTVWGEEEQVAAAADEHALLDDPIPPATEVDPGALSQLVSMGFDAQRARQALLVTHNNVEAATNRLLGS